ncbi:recombinase family protein [Streptomyces sp. HUAS TT20]|uniref:recombinase family protein n=1 Tax=Streptomyces sp. HUAS TT20 TaxID=3447509 RepID=UPI0021D9DB38|nr:recombinase family protein [Streptomyces sp. HUAS 15-9]UXY29455.1 recombinase family protein [Streptomyces sp. HUAS 15-9]
MDRPETTDYDGCGKCLVGVRRLSRKSESTNSPEKQGDLILKATTEVGGHIIGWADDWEVSGATDPLTRPEFGPWLRGEREPYDGIVGAAVDRIGRNVRDVLNTAYTIHGAGQLLVTADHPGVWDLDDPNQESELLVKALGAQLEHRAIKKRIQDEHVRARKAGQPKKKPSYGYMYVRRIPTGKVDEIVLHPEASKEIRNVAQRILADTTGEITVSTECARLTREGVLTPHDLLAVMYGREPKGKEWTYQTLKQILCSEASLGYLMHKGKPVLGEDGRPKKIAPALWDRATRDALIEKTKAKPRSKGGGKESQAARGTKLLVGIGYCGSCGERLIVNGLKGYGCTARVRGIPTSQSCKPAPTMKIKLLDAIVEEWFLAEYGSGQVMKKEYDPGTGYSAQIADIEADRKRLREDRSAGLYDAEDDAEWFRTEYARMGEEIAELKKLPERPAGMRMIPTDRTIAHEWRNARDDAARRELLHEFGVKVRLFPLRAKDRVKVEGVNVFELVR